MARAGRRWFLGFAGFVAKGARIPVIARFAVLVVVVLLAAARRAPAARSGAGTTTSVVISAVRANQRLRIAATAIMR